MCTELEGVDPTHQAYDNRVCMPLAIYIVPTRRVRSAGRLRKQYRANNQEQNPTAAQIQRPENGTRGEHCKMHVAGDLELLGRNVDDYDRNLAIVNGLFLQRK